MPSSTVVAHPATQVDTGAAADVDLELELPCRLLTRQAVGLRVAGRWLLGPYTRGPWRACPRLAAWSCRLVCADVRCDPSTPTDAATALLGPGAPGVPGASSGPAASGRAERLVLCDEHRRSVRARALGTLLCRHGHTGLTLVDWRPL